MLYALMLTDKPDRETLRTEVRPAHVAYLEKIAERIAFAGPLVKDDGTTMIGSLLVIDFASRDEAHAWMEAEPMYAAGLYASSTIQAFVNRWPQRVGFPPPRA